MSNEIIINPEQNHSLIPSDKKPSPFQQLVTFTLSTVAPNSRKTYRQTYRRWYQWCRSNQIDPMMIIPNLVTEYLISLEVTKKTRQRHLSALRKLARVLALDYQNPEYKMRYDALLMIKVPEENLAGNERVRRALSAQDVWKVLAVWHKDTKLAKRNKAMLAVMFYSGLRRAEICALRWRDIDFQAGIIRVQHGKGDKYREAAIVEDRNDSAINALQVWQSACPNRNFIFCPVLKGDHLGKDHPIHVRALNQITEKTALLSGIEFKPHDARRTLGTDLLANGHSTADVQAQLGHSHASTTIQGYALPADARKRRSRFKTTY
ncbi:tyrosine recombinase XerC [Anaerolineales bacterium]